MRSQKGFTLVESIVIAVIVAILALIAVQLYSGYVNHARQEAVTNMAHTAAAAANAYWRKTNTDPPSADSLNLFFADNSFTVAISGNLITVTRDGFSDTAHFRP
jgi:prepilin-type N-terminal cleavage/methylation domain-containing protein